MQTRYLISCDWGTSRFRLRVVDSKTLSILAEVKTDNGIQMLSASFEQLRPHSVSRRQFYLRYLQERIDQLQTTVSFDDQVPVIVSGMASSAIGIEELPYATLPCPVSGDNLITQWIQEAADCCTHPVLLISGLASDSDVMRGEETQVIGLHHSKVCDHPEIMYILPGTHSKHVLVKDNRIMNFKTFMTGELFELLRTHSILRSSVSWSGGPVGERENGYFLTGVDQGGKDPFSHSLFAVRTNILLRKYPQELNYFYLSGLLIAEELQALNIGDHSRICLSADGMLMDLYRKALDRLSYGASVTVVPSPVADTATAIAHSLIFQTRSHGYQPA